MSFCVLDRSGLELLFVLISLMLIENKTVHKIKEYSILNGVWCFFLTFFSLFSAKLCISICEISEATP